MADQAIYHNCDSRWLNELVSHPKTQIGFLFGIGDMPLQINL
jgi:hypothetical protein